MKSLMLLAVLTLLTPVSTSAVETFTLKRDSTGAVLFATMNVPETDCTVTHNIEIRALGSVTSPSGRGVQFGDAARVIYSRSGCGPSYGFSGVAKMPAGQLTVDLAQLTNAALNATIFVIDTDGKAFSVNLAANWAQAGQTAITNGTAVSGNMEFHYTEKTRPATATFSLSGENFSLEGSTDDAAFSTILNGTKLVDL